MNASVYIFGEFNSGYSQYPDDYAASIFKKFSANAKSTTQIAIHRDGNLVYYGYIRKLQEDKYIGLCIVLNGLMFNRIEGLFSLFENTISNLVSKGMFVHFDEQGNLVTSVEKLYLNKEEIQLFTESFRAGISRFKTYCPSLPAVSYGTSKDSKKDFVIDDNHDEIIKSSYTNGYTYIYKSKGFNTAQLNSYQGVLSKSYKENQELKTELTALKEEHAKALRQKKQYEFVFVLFLILFCCAIGLFSLNDNLKKTNEELFNTNYDLGLERKALSSANDTISMQTEQISNLHNEIYELDAQRREEENKRIEDENNLEELQKKIGDIQPFIVKSTSFNFSTGYLNIEYYGMVEESVYIQLKAFNDKVSYGNSSTINVHKGDNTVKVYLSRDLTSQDWYSFEILKGNVILGGHRQ